MFLSFLTTIPNRRECFLAVIFQDEIGQSKIMDFSFEKRPAFKDDKEVLIGYSKPVAPGAWDFNWIGGGHLSTEGDPQAPAIDFFYTILKALESDDPIAVEGAKETMASYIEQTKEFYFGDGEDQADIDLIEGSIMDPGSARAYLEKSTTYLH